jgi:hypothetical protein
MNNILPPSTLLLSLVLWSCGGESSTPTSPTTPTTPTTPVATTIQLSLVEGAYTLPGLNLTARFTAVVKSQTGATMSGASVTWTSSNAAVATVSGGLVTSVAVGTATITASSGSANAAASMTVAIPEFTVMVGESATSSISVNQEITLPIKVDMSKAAGVDIASLQVKVTWDASLLSFVSYTKGPFGTATTNATGTSTGTFIANLYDGTGQKESFNALILKLKGVAAGPVTVEVEVTTAGTELGKSVLDKVKVRNHGVTVSN